MLQKKNVKFDETATENQIDIDSDDELNFDFNFPKDFLTKINPL